MTKDDVKTLARLSRLAFTDEECEAFLPEMDEIVAFAGTVNSEIEGDTSTVRLSSDEMKFDDLREDEILPSLPSDKILSNVEGDDGYFTVKRFIK
ncbi:MAG: aspartyl/glutamyl-tRNA amidotransferase subunit C [Clostridia bacterium]|nr:aspartyl/glutamyl-tRNA amidotransferase subunit C [Clostridia bacterium]